MAVICSGSSLTHTIFYFPFIFNILILNTLLFLCLYKVYLAFIVSQDESWRVMEFYGRKGTKLV